MKDESMKRTFLLLCIGSLAALRRRRGLVCAAILVAAFLGLQSQTVRADSAVAWGINPNGQLGDGTTTDHDTPMPVSGMDSGVTAVAAAGHFHSLAVKNGGAYAWGFNSTGQLGDGTTTTRLTPVPVSGLASGVTAVAGGGFVGNPEYAQSLAVQNGAAFAWGHNTFGQLGDGTTTTRLTPVPVSGMGSGVTAIAAGTFHTLAVQNGKLWAWGSNDSGELGIGVFPTGLPSNSSWRYPTPVAVIGMDSGVTAVAAGRYFSLAVKEGGVYSWGRNDSGQLGDGSFVLKTNTPQLVAGLESGATAVAAFDDISLAVAGGHAYYWGSDTRTPVPVDPANLSNIVAVAAGYEIAYALSSDGRLWSWRDQNGGLPTPQELLPPPGQKFTSIAAGVGSAVATVVAIPEPSTLLLLCIGSLAVLWWRRVGGLA